jgi:hypothetical protein
VPLSLKRKHTEIEGGSSVFKKSRIPIELIPLYTEDPRKGDLSTNTVETAKLGDYSGVEGGETSCPTACVFSYESTPDDKRDIESDVALSTHTS